MTKNNINQHLITANEMNEEGFPCFNSDKERLKYMRNAYKNVPLSKAFSIFYDVELNQETKQNKNINNIINIELGQILQGTVKSIDNSSISFSIPGVKEEIVCKENFTSCLENIQSYLLTHNNKLIFEVREKRNNTYYVSIINGYYRTWVNDVNKAIKNENGINVHIDALVQGGYLAHTDIINLNSLTGRNYTHLVFIPGSHIVLNIERDFEKWIDQDVIIVPQKFVEFKKNFKTGETENSLVGSRKRVLQILGNNNIAELYNIYKLAEKSDVKYSSEYYDGVVTGIINGQSKTGVFVELTDMYITGLLPVESYELVNYKPGDEIKVKIKNFEIQEGKEPIVYNKKGKILKCNVRPIFTT